MGASLNAHVEVRCLPVEVVVVASEMIIFDLGVRPRIADMCSDPGPNAHAMQDVQPDVACRAQPDMSPVNGMISSGRRTRSPDILKIR